ncbi:MAG: type IV pilus modification protein PilV [Nitrospirota bacterium]
MVRSALQKQRQSGFTLLETLIAISILAFGLLAVVTMIDVSFNAGQLSKNTTKATELAGWMMDRIRQDTSLVSQPYTASIISVRTYDNDATTAVALDTDSALDPVNEPGRAAIQQWRALIQGAAVAGYIGADTLRGDRLPRGRGRVTIVPYDVSKGGNHAVTVLVTWGLPSGIISQGVRLESVLATAE